MLPSLVRDLGQAFLTGDHPNRIRACLGRILDLADASEAYLGFDKTQTRRVRDVSLYDQAEDKPVIDLTTREAAKALDIPHSTLKGWLQKIPIPVAMDEDGYRRSPQTGLDLLNRIKTLRMEEGKSLGTVRRLLGLDTSQTNPERARSEPECAIAELQRVLITEVVQAIQSQTDLAEKYARAAHHIGELEEKIRHLEASETEARQLITDGSRKQEELEAACQDLCRRLAEEEKARHQAETKLAQVRERGLEIRPWWRRLLSWSPA